MKKFLYAAQVIFLGLFVFTLLASLLQFSGKNNLLVKFDYQKPVYNHSEEYDPSLSRLNTLKKLEQYCDSLFSATRSELNKNQLQKN